MAGRRRCARNGARRVRAVQQWIGLRSAPLAAGLARLLVMTLRLTRDESRVASLLGARTPAIFVMWHSRVLILPVVYGRRLPMWALISRSRDGEIVARYLERLGLKAVRASSSRGGAAGFRQLGRVLAAGGNVVIVPDGPRGPREVLKPGVIALARMTGAPIVPVAVGAAREWRLSSWDAFRIPKPFSRCVIRAGPPIRLEPATDPRDAERIRKDVKDVEAALSALVCEVDAEVRR
jgi:lysophospholipid acyltransferase (LPLAT)-like uncharacterized protein